MISFWHEKANPEGQEISVQQNTSLYDRYAGVWQGQEVF
jgi:hypothetical protein